MRTTPLRAEYRTKNKLSSMVGANGHAIRAKIRGPFLLTTSPRSNPCAMPCNSVPRTWTVFAVHPTPRYVLVCPATGRCGVFDNFSLNGRVHQHIYDVFTVASPQHRGGTGGGSRPGVALVIPPNSFDCHVRVRQAN